MNVPKASHKSANLERIRRVVLTDETCRNLFEDYAAHLASERGKEEIGWLLMGWRGMDAAVVASALPAGSARDASHGHVHFDPIVQSVACRILLQRHRELTTLGVLHTHPGTLRHPSTDDYEGDREWIVQLRGGQGIFGIGTVELNPRMASDVVEMMISNHPAPNVQRYQGLRFDWYGLAAGDRTYEKLPVELTLGPDLASSLRSVWDVIEAQASRLEALAEKMKRVRFEIGESNNEPAILTTIPLAEQAFIRVLSTVKSSRFFWVEHGELQPVELPIGIAPDQGVQELLSERKRTRGGITA